MWNNDLLSRNISSTRPHNMANFSPLPAEIGLPVWNTPANVNGFRVLSSLLQRRRSLEANQTLHDVGRLLRWFVHSFILFGQEPSLLDSSA